MPTHWKFLLALVLTGLLTACGSTQWTGTPRTDRTDSSPDRSTVARWAEVSLTLAELDSAYAASVGGRVNAADSSLEAYREFLSQYVNFRLKVRAARDAGMDTLASVRRDINNYVRKRVRPQLMREQVYEPVIRSLYERRQEEVDVSHILIRVSSSSDSAEARRTLQTIVDSLARGVPFAELAYRNSEDPSAQRRGQRGYRGHLGYIRAGQIVVPFEKRMYALEPGDVSDIFRTQYGYHVIKVHGRREAKPPVRVSHILREPSGDSAAARQFLDSLRSEIVSGETTFARAARKHSSDQRSARRGGDLGAVSPQALPDPMQAAVASMDTIGTVSDVVQTRFGLHLIKLTDRETEKSFEEAYDELKKQISGQPRLERQKRTFAESVWANAGLTVDTTRLLNAADVASVDSLARPLLSFTDNVPAASAQVASIGDSTFTVRRMAEHLTQTDGGAQMTVGELIDSFLTEKAFQYATVRLAHRDPSFATEIKKYREGVLLFRYMQDSVWTAAARDTVGLRRTFEQNRDQYRFPERVQTIVLRAPSDSLLAAHRRTYENTQSIASTVRNASKDSLVSVDTIMVTDESAEVYRGVENVSDGELVGPVSRQNESILLIRDTLLAPRRKTFEEARSQVVQDYQEIYEDEVIRQLRDRYDVETYPNRLRPPSQGSRAP